MIWRKTGKEERSLEGLAGRWQIRKTCEFILAHWSNAEQGLTFRSSSSLIILHLLEPANTQKTLPLSKLPHYNFVQPQKCRQPTCCVYTRFLSSAQRGSPSLLQKKNTHMSILEFIGGKVTETIERLIALYRPDSLVVGTRGARGVKVLGAAISVGVGSISR